MLTILNDIHSQLNETTVAEVRRPSSADEVVTALGDARARGLRISVSGARHAMGGQQFGGGTLHLDCRGLDRVIETNAVSGLIRLGAGCQWPAIIQAVRAMKSSTPWGIRQKQTGADDLTLGGAVSANAHGRGLAFGPFVEDVEALTVVLPDGSVAECSRANNPELFALVCGGYGLFGVIVDVTLRLVPRQKLVRLVDVCDIDEALVAVHRRAADGCIYGDFQYAIESRDDEFLRRGVFACYRPARPDAPEPDASADLPPERWRELLRLAHDDPRTGFGLYAGHYIATHGRTYWSDTMQLSTYLPGYAEFLAGPTGGPPRTKGGDRLSAAPGGAPNAAPGAPPPKATLMISELYVPPDALPAFMSGARRVLRETGVRDIYGTIRAIRPDTRTFLPWAQGERACIIFNLLVEHHAKGIARAQQAFRGLIDVAASLGGSYFLTYHRWATREQLERCHPRIREWMREKRRVDPDGLLTSDWYEHIRSQLEERG